MVAASGSNPNFSSTDSGGTSIVNIHGKKPYVPGVREPYQLPALEVQLPSPDRLPQSPPSFNFISIIPPVLMGVGTVAIPLITKAAFNPMLLLPLVASLGFPAANLIYSLTQKKKYKKLLVERGNQYQVALERKRQELIALSAQQRSVLDIAHPAEAKVVDLALMKGINTQLWWRRPKDNDFLGLRIGVSKSAASFKVQPPRMIDPFDDLSKYADPIIHEFKLIDKVPFLLDLKTTGSVGLTGTQPDVIYGAARRLIIDLLTHHSPLDVNLALVSDTGDGVNLWGSLKWAPHTLALEPGEKQRMLNFTGGMVNDFVDWLSDQYKERSRSKNQSSGYVEQTALVVIFADRGNIRQSPELAPIVEHGHEVKIYTIFLGERNLPRVRCQLSVDQGYFRYAETWEGGNSTRGVGEFTSLEDLEAVCRSLAQLEPLGARSSYELPEAVRLSHALAAPVMSDEDIRNTWQLKRSDRELLQFPVGVTATRDGLQLLNLNLLPAERGGQDGYHTILIGTTGSGKSEFLKTLVLASALKYSPAQLTFFTMDFKGGSTFNRLKCLPHVVGVVDNLGPALVERGINAIQNEIDRRSSEFARLLAKDIWEYNLRSPQPMPHLLLVLDEFARGIKEFPQLTPILDLLVRQGRSLGMYLILANQEVNAAVENLSSNVGWRIALKVANREELNLISKECSNPRRSGQGYMRSLLGDIWEFQAGYGGRPWQRADNEVQEFIIQQVEPDGTRKSIYTSNSRTERRTETTELITEQEAYLRMIDTAAQALEIQQARRIYSDPLPTEIWLGAALDKAPRYRKLTPDGYSDVENDKSFMKAYIGSLDYPERCVQGPLAVDFLESDTHLWIVGSSGSGKAVAVKTILSSLAATHTPEEVNFYVIELGSGELKKLEQLPHTGAVITATEKERLERLIGYLDREITRRTGGGERDTQPAEQGIDANKYSTDANIVLVINNFAELAANYPDLVERIPRLISNGKSARIHVIITTNRGGELRRNISSLIARRLVFQLAQSDEYSDVLNARITSVPLVAQGRGYWRNFDISECQLARPQSSAEGSFEAYLESSSFCAKRQKYRLPYPILEMPKEIPLINHLDQVGATLPGRVWLGLDHEAMQPLDVDLRDSQFWVVLSPIGRGKTNTLAVLMNNIARLAPDEWDMYALSFKRNDLAGVLSPAARTLVKQTHGEEELILTLDAMQTVIKNRVDGDKRWLIVLDDLPKGFANADLAKAIEGFYRAANNATGLLVVASGLREDFQTRYSFDAVKTLKQNQTGVILSSDGTDIDWLGVPLATFNQYRKSFGQMQEGDGFLIRRGKILKQLRFFLAAK